MQIVIFELASHIVAWSKFKIKLIVFYGLFELWDEAWLLKFLHLEISPILADRVRFFVVFSCFSVIIEIFFTCFIFFWSIKERKLIESEIFTKFKRSLKSSKLIKLADNEFLSAIVFMVP
jgi:hypothetical protein